MEKSINEKEQCVQTDVMQSVLLTEKDLIDKIAEKELKTELYERPNTNINPGA